jgi:hypothetical protein
MREMMKTFNRDHASQGGEECWEERYVAGCRDLLEGRPLDPALQALVTAVETAAAALPGELEVALLRFGLTRADEVPELRLAASTSPPASIYELVRQALAAGKDHLAVELGRGETTILQVVASEGIFVPCYLENWTFTLEREDGQVETVGPYGGVFLSMEQLKRLQLIYNPEERTVQLRRI